MAIAEHEHERWLAQVTAAARDGGGDPAARARLEREHPELSEETWFWEGLGQLGEPDGRAEMSDAELLAATLDRLARVEPKDLALIDDEPAPTPAAPGRRHLWIAAGVTLVAAAAAMFFLVPAGVFEARSARELESAASMVSGGDDDARAAEVKARQRDPHAPSAPRRAHVPPTNDTEADELDETTQATEVDAVEATEADAVDAVDAVDALDTLDASDAGDNTDETERAGDPDESHADAAETDAEIEAPGPDELLSRAQALLGRGEQQAALRVYRKLVRQYPRSAEAGAALVTLGRSALAKGQASAALRHFNRYLKRGPERLDQVLAQEAEIGRIDALRELGRDAEERAAIEAFLREHPKSLYSTRLRRRLE